MQAELIQPPFSVYQVVLDLRDTGSFLFENQGGNAVLGKPLGFQDVQVTPTWRAAVKTCPFKRVEEISVVGSFGLALPLVLLFSNQPNPTPDNSTQIWHWPRDHFTATTINDWSPTDFSPQQVQRYWVQPDQIYFKGYVPNRSTYDFRGAPGLPGSQLLVTAPPGFGSGSFLITIKGGQ